MEQILDFIANYWLGVLIGFLVLMFILWIGRTIFKLIALALFVGLILIFGFNYTPNEVIKLASQGATAVADFYNDNLKDVVNAELKNAKVTHEENGKYSIQTKSLKVTGVKGETTAIVTFKNKSYELPVKQLGDGLQKLINEPIAPGK